MLSTERGTQQTPGGLVWERPRHPALKTDTTALRGARTEKPQWSRDQTEVCAPDALKAQNSKRQGLEKEKCYGWRRCQPRRGVTWWGLKSILLTGPGKGFLRGRGTCMQKCWRGTF